MNDLNAYIVWWHDEPCIVVAKTSAKARAITAGGLSDTYRNMQIFPHLRSKLLEKNVKPLDVSAYLDKHLHALDPMVTKYAHLFKRRSDLSCRYVGGAS